MSPRISATEAKRIFSKLLRKVQEGQSYVLLSHGRAVARIQTCDVADTDRHAAFEGLLQRLTKQPAVDIGPWERDGLYEY